MSAVEAHGDNRNAPEPRFGFWWRSYAMLVKEFIQLRRDRVSFAMIVMLPVMQLVLFGFAINTTPHHLPAAVLVRPDGYVAWADDRLATPWHAAAAIDHWCRRPGQK